MSPDRELGVPLELQKGNRASSLIEVVEIGVPPVFQQGSQASSQVVVWNSGFFSICNMGVGLHLELSWGTQVSYLFAAGDSELLSSYSGSSVFLSSCSTGFRVPLKPWWGIRGSS